MSENRRSKGGGWFFWLTL